MGEPRFDFRPLAEADLPLLFEWLNRPHLVGWMHGPITLPEVQREYGAHIESSSLDPYLACVEGVPVGYIQSYVAMEQGGGWWTDESDPGVIGTDQFLAEPERLGRGLGTAMVGQFTARLLGDPAVTRIQVDPAPDNGRAIRCYEKVGFRPAGPIETPDGPALLMTLDRPRGGALSSLDSGSSA